MRTIKRRIKDKLIEVFEVNMNVREENNATERENYYR